MLTSVEIDITEHKLLRKLITSTTKKCVAEKADTFDSDEFQSGTEEMCDEEEPKELIDKVASLCLYYSIHLRSEVLQIEKQDVVLANSEDIDVHFLNPTKRHAAGFSCMTPRLIKSTFMKKVSQLAPKLD